MSQRVLVIEDEVKLAALQRDYFENAGFTVELRHHGRGAAEWILEREADIVVLDLMLPGEDGLSICRRVREHSAVPIIMVTARVAEVDRLLGLESGADDYLCKPFSPRELVLRVAAILRRGKNPHQVATDVLRYAGITMDSARHHCSYDGRDLVLTPVEFRLLAALLTSPGKVLSRDRLMSVAYADHRVVSDRTIDSHMRNLRHKLEAARGGRTCGELEGSEGATGSKEPNASEEPATQARGPQLRSVYGVGYECS